MNTKLRYLLAAAAAGWPMLSVRAAEPGEAAPGMGGELVQVMLALLAVVALIVVLFGLIRKLNFMPGAGNGPIKVISGVSLGAKERLLLIQVGEEQLLVSASPGRVSRIHKLERPISAAAQPAAAPAGAGMKKGFAQVLQAVTAGRSQ